MQSTQCSTEQMGAEILEEKLQNRNKGIQKVAQK